jgi:hypothetical protein
MMRIDELYRELREKLRAIRPSIRFQTLGGSVGRKGFDGRPHVEIRWLAEEGNLTREEKKEVVRLIDTYLVEICHVRRTYKVQHGGGVYGPKNGSGQKFVEWYEFNLIESRNANSWQYHLRQKKAEREQRKQHEAYLAQRKAG